MASMVKPNIVFILMDNLGFGELGVYAGGILRGAPSPRIDKLAAEGTRLTNFNVEAQCTPSRSAVMTGRFATRSGTHSVPFGGGLDGLTQWEVTIAELLSGAGYLTGHFGKWHLGSTQGRFPNDQGFDEWYGIPRTTDEAFWPSDPGAKAAGVPQGESNRPTAAQLKELVTQIALYSDTLVAQILGASQYSTQIVEADRYSGVSYQGIRRDGFPGSAF